MTPGVRRGVSVALIALVVVLAATTVWFLVSAAGGSVLDLGVPCGSVLRPAPPRTGLVTDCRAALAGHRRAAATSALGTGVSVIALVGVRLVAVGQDEDDERGGAGRS